MRMIKKKKTSWMGHMLYRNCLLPRMKRKERGREAEKEVSEFKQMRKKEVISK